MPSKSEKQRRFMAAAAHNPRFAKKAGVKQSVAREFHKSDQGALKRAMGGSVRRAAGRSAPTTATRGALGRAASRIASPAALRGNHMVRSAGPIKPETLSGTDATLAETGDGLRNVVGRIATRGRIAASKGGPIHRGGSRREEKINESIEYSPLIDSPRMASTRKINQRFRVRHGDKGIRDLVEFDRDRTKRESGPVIQSTRRRNYAEGGKVGTAMSALQALAKKYQAALESGDALLARRLKRELELKKQTVSEEEPTERKAREDKLATFAKGGKVKGLRGLARAFRARMDDKEGYIREGFGKTREEARAKLREEVAYDNGEDTVDALLEEHGVTYRKGKE